MTLRIAPALFAATAAFALSGCVTDGYGYGGVDVGYGSGYYGGGPYYGSPYWGWYDDYYYPGIGYYVYDRGGARHRWSDSHRRYWEGRRGDQARRENWSGFRRDGDARPPAWRPQNGAVGRTDQQRREAWQARRQHQQEQRAAAPSNGAARVEAWRAQNADRLQNSDRGQRQGGTPGWRGRRGQQQ